MAQDSLEFAVVDVETTGLFPGGHDRVIEIAVLRVSGDGALLGEFCSLVNPRRDVGPTHIHGIRAADVAEAPTFEEVLGDVLALVSGAVFVAHNVSFDARFLRAESVRAGIELPEVPELCTMRLARRVDPSVAGRRLEDLCCHFGVDPGLAHSARDDARATARLLALFLARVSSDGSLSLQELGLQISMPPRIAWPNVEPSGKCLARAEATRRRTQATSYIAQLVTKLPADGNDTLEVAAYEDLLDRALEDRRVTTDEIEALDALAHDSGLSRTQAVAVHERYLLDLLRVALEDDYISESEAEDLEEVRRLLGVSKSMCLLLEEQARKLPCFTGTKPAPESLAGKSVCFTGTMRCVIDCERATRSLAQRMAAEAGMIVKKGVSKKLDILVLADPDSASTKARRARELGVRLVAESVFWQMIGVSTS